MIQDIIVPQLDHGPIDWATDSSNIKSWLLQIESETRLVAKAVERSAEHTARCIRKILLLPGVVEVVRKYMTEAIAYEQTP